MRKSQVAYSPGVWTKFCHFRLVAPRISVGQFALQIVHDYQLRQIGPHLSWRHFAKNAKILSKHTVIALGPQGLEKAGGS